MRCQGRSGSWGGQGLSPFFPQFKATFVWHSQRLLCGCCFLQACEERKND